ncbi:hypothetical protein NDU88_000022 [Pleurodeles waltl]|uniref:Uncharacterized protein n=1 Tax=Pleurodeles waltl TaxID=8319 RepID=A0AAV7KM37_PLEWA|nr:hypothetical protein NDU88_000022 [Pleurodeles waltl]
MAEGTVSLPGYSELGSQAERVVSRPDYFPFYGRTVSVTGSFRSPNQPPPLQDSRFSFSLDAAASLPGSQCDVTTSHIVGVIPHSHRGPGAAGASRVSSGLLPILTSPRRRRHSPFPPGAAGGSSVSSGLFPIRPVLHDRGAPLPGPGAAAPRLRSRKGTVGWQKPGGRVQLKKRVDEAGRRG